MPKSLKFINILLLYSKVVLVVAEIIKLVKALLARVLVPAVVVSIFFSYYILLRLLYIKYLPKEINLTDISLFISIVTVGDILLNRIDLVIIVNTIDSFIIIFLLINRIIMAVIIIILISITIIIIVGRLLDMNVNISIRFDITNITKFN